MLRWCVLALLAIGAAGATETLVCVGDGFTSGYGLDERDAYPAQLDALLRSERLDWTVRDASASDDTVDDALHRIQDIIATRPALVLIELGWIDGRSGRSTRAIAKGLGAICDRLRRANVAVALCAVRLPQNYGDDYCRRFAAAFEAVAIARRLPLLPSMLDGVAGNASFTQADRLHPNAAGQRVVAQRLYAFLRPMLTSRPEDANAVPPGADLAQRRRASLAGPDREPRSLHEPSCQ